ncbi:MAG: transglycosylase SLT domain-containing protein [Bacteroidetes bacterium]|nr:transglycosylase SLT domain-containing protein [Bacteroidota bacterium]MCA6444714.1 transglycosylase SLT domain-containing protein [Bacteroidota bacterium]
MYLVPPKENEITYVNNNGVVIGVSIPKNLNFCNEKIPNDNIEIKKRLEEALTSTSKWKNHSSLIFEKVKRWFGVIEPVIIKNGLPLDVKYLAIVESQLSNVSSPMGASGFWQLVPNSAQNYGLEINEYVDERLDVIKSTEAACKHLKDAYAEFNNWTLAAAAYNRGIGGISNAIKKQQVSNYYDLNLNPETKKFIYKILAYKTLIESPQNLGIKKKSLKYKNTYAFKTIKVDTPIKNLKLFAKKYKCPYTTFKIFNPWLLKDELPNINQKTYHLRIPQKPTLDYSEYLRDLLGEDGQWSDDLLPKANDMADSIKVIYHTVLKEETMQEIADFYDISEKKLREINGLQEGINPEVGTKLKLVYVIKPKK